MAVKFTKGDSMRTTTHMAQAHKVAKEPHAKNHVLRGNNTASGLPGYISSGANAGEGGAKGGKAGSAGPKYSAAQSMHSTRSISQNSRMSGAIGERGPVGPRSHGGFGPASLKKGTQVKSYRAASLHAGSGHHVKSNTHDGHPGRMEKLRGRAKMSSERY